MKLSKIGYGKRLLVIVAALMLIIIMSFSFSVAAQTPIPTPSPSASAAASPSPSPTSAPLTQVQFHDAMRKLWIDHNIWHWAVINSIFANLPDLNAREARQLQNQADIGNAIKPYYGEDAGNQLTALLSQHIGLINKDAMDMKTGDTAALNTDKAATYANGNDIASFLAKANPNSWPLAAAQGLLKGHIDSILAIAQAGAAATKAGANGDWNAEITAFDTALNMGLMLADVLSQGIVAQFSTKFAGPINPDLYPTPTASPSLSPSSSPLPSPSLTPVVTPTPAPTATPAPSGAPSVSILQPAINTYLVGSEDISVVVQVFNFNLADKTGQANVPGEGHLIYYLNVQPPTTPGQPTLTAPGTYAISADTSYLWNGLAEGVYTFSVQLVNNDNTPLVPPVVATSTNTVYPG